MSFAFVGCLAEKKHITSDFQELFIIITVIGQPTYFIYCKRSAHGQTDRENENKISGNKSWKPSSGGQLLKLNASCWLNYYILAFLFLFAIFFLHHVVCRIPTVIVQCVVFQRNWHVPLISRPTN